VFSHLHLSICMCTWNSFIVLLTGLWRPFSEVSLDSYSLLNVACDVHVHFLLSSFNVDEIKFCVNWTVFQKNSIAAKILMESQNCWQLLTGTLIRTKKYLDSCKLITVNPTKYLSCDKQVSMLQKILHSLATRVARIVLQRAEETFAAVREIIVSVSCLCAQKNYIICQLS
jgi:hypothetical protein